MRRVKPRAPSSPPVVRRVVVGDRGFVVTDLMVFWWRRVRVCHVRIDDGAFRVSEGLWWSLLLLPLSVKPWLARTVFRGQKATWPSVLAVQR